MLCLYIIYTFYIGVMEYNILRFLPRDNAWYLQMSKSQDHSAAIGAGVQTVF